MLNYVNTERQANRELDISNIAAGFQEAIVDVLVDKSMQAVRQYGDGRLVLAGGVAANSRIREAVAKRCEEEGIELFLPEKKLCTDNAAMIACAGYYKYLKCGADSLHLDATANLPF